MLRTAVLLLFFSASCFATGIHKWRDKNGAIVFGDSPPADVPSKTVEVRTNVYTSAHIEALPTQFAPATKVIMYGASWCKYCKKAREYFASHHIPFTEYDVETSEKGREDYRRMHGKGIPIILVGTHRLNGFSPSAFEEAYASR